jgi:replicative DNA helicase
MRHTSEVVAEANEKISSAIAGLRNSYITRWGKLNEGIEAIQEGEIIVIGGRPGSGKSAFANLLIQDIFDQHLNPYPTIGAYFSLEMPAYQQIIRWYSNDRRIQSKRILSSRNPIDEATFESLKQTGEMLKRMNIMFYDVPLQPESVGNTVLDLKRRNPGKQVILMLDHSRLVIGDPKEEEIKIRLLMEIAVRLKNEHGIITIILSQMNRDIEKERDRARMGKSLPVMADLFGASAVEQNATTVLLLHRPEMYGLETFYDQDAKNLLVINVAKQRDGWTGGVFLKSDFQYYDVHDGNTVAITADGLILNFVQ